MFEIFGWLPLLKVIFITLLTIWLSAFLGVYFAAKKTKNIALRLTIGLVMLFGLIAIINSNGISIFTPVCISIFAVFKPKLSLKDFDFKAVNNIVVSFFKFFIPFLLIELFRQSYFSNDFINSSWADYASYISASKSILQFNIETPTAYLANYLYEPSFGLYHYFDIYALFPIFFAGLSPLLGYLFYYLPFCYSLAALSLLSIFNLKVNWSIILFALLVINLIGISMLDFSLRTNLNITAYHKASYFLIAILIFVERKNFKLAHLFLLMGAITIALNPIIFCLSISSLGLLLIFNKLKDIGSIKSLWNRDLLLCTITFIVFFILAYGFFGDNNYFTDTLEKSEAQRQYWLQVIMKFKNQISTFQFLPVFLIFMVYLVYTLLKREVSEVILFCGIALIISLVVNSLYYKHYDSDQFFKIPLIALLPFLSFYLIFDSSILVKQRLRIGIACVLIISLLIPFTNGGENVYTVPRALDKVSVNYIKKVEKSIGNKSINALYFQEIEEETPNWLNYLPNMPQSIGYLNLFNNSIYTQPLALSFFPNDHPVNAQNIISQGPFEKFLKMNKGVDVESYYSLNFAPLIDKFINEQKINALIFDKTMEIPLWVNAYKTIVVYPIAEFDKHIFIYIE